MATNMLSVIINGDPTGLLGAFATTGNAADSWEKRLKTITQSSTFALGAGLVAVGGAAYALGTQFDDAYDKIRTGTGATGESLNGLETDFKKVVSTVPASFADASTAVSQLNVKLGLTGQPLQDLSGQLLQLSKITETDISTNVAAAAGVFQNFGVATGEQSGKLDMLFRASQASGLSVSDLATKMQDSGVVLRAVGFDFDKSAALIATMGKAGVDVSDIMPALGKSLAMAAKDGKSATDVFTDTFNKIAGAPDSVQAAGVAVEVFGAKAGPKLAEMIREGKLSFTDMMAAVQGGSETITGAAKDTEDFQEKFELLKNKAFVALEPIATRIFNIVGEGMSWITDHANIAIPAILGLVGAFTAWKVATIASKVATEIATAVQWAFNAAMDANPIMLVVIAIAALVAGIVWAYTHVDWFRKAVDTAWQGIKTASLWLWNNVLQPVFNAIAFYITNIVVPYFTFLWETAKVVFEKIAAVVSWAWDNVIQPAWTALSWYISNILIPYYTFLWETAKMVFEKIAAVVMWAWNNVIQPAWAALSWYIENILVPYYTMLWNIVSSVFSWISDKITWAWNTIIKPIWDALSWYIGNVLVPWFTTIWNVASDVFNKIGAVIGWVWNTLISPAFENIKSGIGTLMGVFDSIRDGVSSAFSSLWGLIVEPVKAAINWIIDKWNGLEFTIPKVSAFGVEIGGWTVGTPDIQRFHSGGMFEAPIPGGEGLALLRDREVVLTPEQVAAGRYPATSSGGGDVNVYVNQPAASAYEIGQELRWTMAVLR